MRAAATALIAFLLSMFSGALVAQMIAVSAGMGQEFIAVLFLLPIVAIAAAIAFLAAQWFGGDRKSVDRVGLALTAIMLACAIGLAAFSFYDAWGRRSVAGDLPLLLSVIAPCLTIVVTQWLFVRWRNRPRPT